MSTDPLVLGVISFGLLLTWNVARMALTSRTQEEIQAYIDDRYDSLASLIRSQAEAHGNIVKFAEALPKQLAELADHDDRNKKAISEFLRQTRDLVQYSEAKAQELQHRAIKTGLDRR